MPTSLYSRIALSMVVVALTLTAVSAHAVYYEDVLKDKQFNNGFRASYTYGNTFTQPLKKGDVTLYNQPYCWDGPWALPIYLIPDGTVGQPGVNEDNKYWDFQEGSHTMSNGNPLHRHRFCINPSLQANSPTDLTIALYNYQSGAPIRAFQSNRSNWVRLWYDTSAEIKNEATQYGDPDDDWPHYLLVQNFKEYVNLADYEWVNFWVETKINHCFKNATWPHFEEMTDQVYFLLRNKGNLNYCIWVGVRLFTTDPNGYGETWQNDQWGIPFYRDSPYSYNGALTVGQWGGMGFELKALVTKACQKMGIPATADAWLVSEFNIGWEGVGMWNCDLEMRNLVLQGKHY